MQSHHAFNTKVAHETQMEIFFQEQESVQQPQRPLLPAPNHVSQVLQSNGERCKASVTAGKLSRVKAPVAEWVQQPQPRNQLRQTLTHASPSDGPDVITPLRQAASAT